VKKNKYLIVLLVAVLLLFVCYQFLGLRIVYAPWLDNHWDAIGAIGNWIGVFMTAMLTIIIIVQTQKNAENALSLEKQMQNQSQALNEKLAEESNRTQLDIAKREEINTILNRRIELFERRYNIYILMNDIIGNAVLIDNDLFFVDDEGNETGTLNKRYYEFYRHLFLPLDERIKNSLNPRSEEQINNQAMDENLDYQFVYAYTISKIYETLGTGEFFFDPELWKTIDQFRNEWYKLLLPFLRPNLIYPAIQPFEDFKKHCNNMEENGVLSQIKESILITENYT